MVERKQRLSLREIEENFKELVYYLGSGISSRIKLSILHDFLGIIQNQSSPQRFYSYFLEIQERVPELLHPAVLKYRSSRFLSQLQQQLQMMKDAGVEIMKYLTPAKCQTEVGDPGGFSSDTVWIPLVEREQTHRYGLIQIATIEPLKVQVEQRRTDAETDLIFFNNYPVNMGDPFYNQALDAVGAAKKQLKISRTGKVPKFRIMFGFSDKEYFYTGESFGLGMSLAVLAQMEKITIQRVQHRISESAVITGGIDVNGQVRGVSDQSLPTKIEAFFYSPFQTFVYPEMNSIVVDETWDIHSQTYDEHMISTSSSRAARVAEAPMERRPESREIDQLSSRERLPKLTPSPTQKLKHSEAKEPNNSLTQKRSLLSTSDLITVLKNETIINKKSISFKAWSQAHIRKNQVLRYVAALILITGVGWGSWWFSRDLNPVRTEVTDNVLTAFNGKNMPIWTHEIFPSEFTKTFMREAEEKWVKVVISDLNGDGLNEVIFSPVCNAIQYAGHLKCLNADGTILWDTNLSETEEFGDAEYPPPFIIDDLDIYTLPDCTAIVTAMLNHHPWFPGKIALVSNKGKILDQYYHGGSLSDIELLDVSNDGVKDIVFCGTNNESRDGILGALDIAHISGHSPQQVPHYRHNTTFEATHIFYLRFPKGDWLDLGHKSKNFSIQKILKTGDDNFNITVSNKRMKYSIIYQFSTKMEYRGSSPGDNMLDVYYTLHGRTLDEDFTREFVREKLEVIKSWDGTESVGYNDFQESYNK